MRSNLVSNTFFLIIVQFCNYVVPILVLPYLTRVLGVDNFGHTMVALSFCSICMIITDYGFGLSASYKISRADNVNSVSSLFTSIIIIKLLLLSFLAFIFVTYSIFFMNPTLKVEMIFPILFTIFFQTFQFNWFFQGIEKMSNITIITIASKVIYLLFVFLLVRKDSDYNLVIMGLGFSYVVSSIISFYRYFCEGYRLIRPTVKEIKANFFDSSGFFLSRAAVGIYTSANTFVIGQFSGATQAGLYSSSEKLYQAGQNLTQPITQALYPYLARTKDENTLFKFILFLTPILILGVSICSYYAADIIKIFFGNNFLDSVNILRVLLVCSVVTFISINLGYPAFATYNKLYLVNFTVYVAAIIQTISIISLYLSNKITGFNVALSVLFVELIVLTLRVGFLMKCRRGIKREK